MTDAAPNRGLEAITKVLRVHSGEDFTADDFPTLEEGREAWEWWTESYRPTLEAEA